MNETHREPQAIVGDLRARNARFQVQHGNTIRYGIDDSVLDFEAIRTITRQQAEIERWRNAFQVVRDEAESFKKGNINAMHLQRCISVQFNLAALQAKPRCHCKGVCEAAELGRDCPNEAKPDLGENPGNKAGQSK